MRRRWSRSCPFAFVVALATGCAGVSEASVSNGSVVLGPGGRAECTVVVTPGGTTRLRLTARGSATVAFDVRRRGGETLQSGTLGEAEVALNEPDRTTLTVTLAAQSGASATVGYELAGPETDVTWDLSKANAAPPPKR